MRPYKPLSVVTPRLERLKLEQQYLAKAADCQRLADTANSPRERDEWLKLLQDWTALAKEAKEPPTF